MLAWIATLSLSPAPVPPRSAPEPGSEAPARPVRWLDVDGDGDLDALLLRTDGALRFLRQDAGGGYTDATAQVGLDAVSGASSLLTGDVDGDGREDLVVGGAEGLRLWLQGEGGAFLDVTEGSGLAGAGVVEALDWIDLEADGRPDLHVEGPAAHLVFRGEGPARFRRIEELELATGRVAAPSLAAAGAVAREAPGVDRANLGKGTGPSVTDPSTAAGAPTKARRPARGPVATPTVASGSPSAGVGLTACFKALADKDTPGSCIEASTIPTLGLLHPLSLDFNVDDATGHVGMGTAVPSAGLHSVSEDGLLADGDLFNGSLAIEGLGTRMLWYPKQAVFRAGNVTGTQWNSSQLGPGSAAFGEDTIASGLLSFAAGGDTTASGNYSAAVGGNTEATGRYSVAGGLSTRAAYASTAFGRYNVGGGSDSDWVPTDPLFELGNGTGTSSRSNAFTVLKNGSVGVRTAAPASPLHVIGEVRSSGPGANFAVVNPNNELASVRLDFFNDTARLRIGGTGAGALDGFTIQRQSDATIFRVLNSGDVGIGTETPAFKLEVNGTAGKPGGGSWSSSSDRRLKKNVADLEGALDTLLALRGVTFEYKDPEAIHELAGTRIGFIAQEVEEVLPDWVDEKPDGMKVLTVRGFEALAVEALRELEARNSALVERNAALARRAEDLEARNEELEGRLAAVEAAVERLAAERD